MSAGAAVIRDDPPGPAVAPDTTRSTRPESLWADAWKRMRRNRLAVASAIFWWAWGLSHSSPHGFRPQRSDRPDLSLGASPPSATHWFGTDELGATFARVIYGGGSRCSWKLPALVSLVIGVGWASPATAAARIDEMMMRVVDVLLPHIFLMILLLVFFSRSI